jgi:hypothetical protein
MSRELVRDHTSSLKGHHRFIIRELFSCLLRFALVVTPTAGSTCYRMKYSAGWRLA